MDSNLNDENEDIFVILVATDCHLGFAEKDPIRRRDSFITFEEILKVAKDRKVDFILLGGDLFHENKPSRKCIFDCMTLIRKYCMGDSPVQFAFLSDQSENFKSNPFPCVNYEDPNLNVAIPVFSIHGNHDDPTGVGNLCSLDFLSGSGLINYFGKYTDLEDVQISPLLMQKGSTKIALYGLGSIMDERLHRMFKDKKVRTLRPKEDIESWFNLFVIHQNRAKHGPTSYIPGSFLDEYLDLVIWGHEHECRIQPEWEEYPNHKGFFISQPGSSIATSLAVGEAVPKHIGILTVKGKKFKIEEVPLKTVRPFFIENVSITDSGITRDSPLLQEKFMAFLKEKVDELLNKASLDRIGEGDQLPDKPLIRLRVEIRDQSEIISNIQFCKHFINKVANPRDILLFHVKREGKIKTQDDDFDEEQLQEIIHSRVNQISVEMLVNTYFQNSDDKLKLELLSETGLGLAVNEYVDKHVREAIQDLVNHQIKKIADQLAKFVDLDDTNIDSELALIREERKKDSKAEARDIKNTLDVIRQNAAADSDQDIIVSSDSDVDLSRSTTTTTGRGRGRGGRGRGAAKTAKAAKTSESFDSDSTGPKRGRGRARAANNASGRRGRGKQNTIFDSFQKKPPARGSKSPICISDDSEEDIFPTASRKNVASKKTAKKRGKTSESTDEDF